MNRSVKEEIKAIEDAWNEVNYKVTVSTAKAEIKALWKDAWNEYKVLWANAKAEVQAKQFQKDINKLAKQAERVIVELKKNPHL